MSAYHLLDNDKKKNQFSREERQHLLGIMCQYAPLLDNKNASIVGRKEIWETIERKFNEAGFVGKTSAQLKKYWQNYKYHNKRLKALRKENDGKRAAAPVTKLDMASPTLGLDAEGWEGRVGSKVEEAVDNRDDVLRKSRGEIYEENGLSFRKLSVSNTPTVSSAPGNRCGSSPKRCQHRSTSILSDNRTEARLALVEPADQVIKRQDSRDEQKESAEADKDPANVSLGGERGERNSFLNGTGERSRSSAGVMDDKSKNSVSTGLLVSNAEISDNSVTVSILCPEAVPRNILAARKVAGLSDTRPDKLLGRCKSSRNPDRPDLVITPTDVGGESSVVKEKGPCPRADRFPDYATRVKSEGSVQSVKDTSGVMRNKALCFLLPRRWNEKEVGMNESAPSTSRTRHELGSVEQTQTQACDSVKPETSTTLTHRGVIKVKDVAMLSGVNRVTSSVTCQENRETASRPDSDEPEILESNRQDEASDSRKRRREDVLMRIRNARLKPNERNSGRNAAETDARNELRKPDSSFDDTFQNEFQELNHQLILRQLETEEKRLKVKVAEMSVQEVQFRIRALNEDMRRAEELHELRLALTAGRKANLV